MAQVSYETLGHGYSAARTSDPRIMALIEETLGDARTVLNVGAGTGSYEPPGRSVTALEPSPTMLRQRATQAAPAVRGASEGLPFRDGAFDAVMALLTIHHWRDRRAGYAELRRIAPRRLVLTFDPEVTARFWLAEYFPGLDQALPEDVGIAEVVEGTGANRVVPVPVPWDCADGFLAAYWRRPQAYLDPIVQSGISGIRLLDSREREAGLARLARDIESGVWRERHGHLLDLEELDAGYRLVIA